MFADMGYKVELIKLFISVKQRFPSSFTGATTLCGSGPPPWFRNSTFFRGAVVSPSPNPQPGGPGTTLRLAWVALPGAYDPSSIAITSVLLKSSFTIIKLHLDNYIATLLI
jgi:hypothetical protein